MEDCFRDDVIVNNIMQYIWCKCSIYEEQCVVACQILDTVSIFLVFVDKVVSFCVLRLC